MYEAKEEFIDGALSFQEALYEHRVLIDNRLTAADIFCGCYLAYTFLNQPKNW
jgi:glutathione S-transferase